MNRKSGNVSKTKKLISRPSSGSKAISRKSFQKLSDSSSTTSKKNSSEQSEDFYLYGAYSKTQVNKNISYEEEELLKKKLQVQLKELRHKLKILEEAHENKDYFLNAVTREKERALGEIRRLEKYNKLLRQQLNDERNHYLEEKEKFCEEMTRFKKRLQEAKLLEEKKQNEKWNLGVPFSRQSFFNQQFRWQFNKEKGDYSDSKVIDQKTLESQKLSGIKESVTKSLRNMSCSDSQIGKSGSLESWHLYEGNDLSLQMAALKTENAKLRSIICERDERNYELCLRFLRMKHCKNDIRTRFQNLENEYLQVITNLMEKIDEARHEFNFIIDQKFKRPLHSTNAMYLQLVQRNSRMAFENASLRLQNQCLKKELNKYMNSNSSNEKKIDHLILEGEQPLRIQLTESKCVNKFKKLKKNVNFKEIQTIYERKSLFNNSDTDSNYMSKTSTTIPSNGSLADPKSNENIIKYTADMQTNKQKKFHSQFQNSCEQNHRSWLFPHQDELKFFESVSESKPLPDDILKKIFKRIDTSSCHSDSSRSKDLNLKSKDKIWEKESKLEKKNCFPESTLNKEIHKNKGSFRMVSNSDILPWKVAKGNKSVKEKNKFQLRRNKSSSLNGSKESVLLNCKKGKKDVILKKDKHNFLDSNEHQHNVKQKLTKTKFQSQLFINLENSESKNNFSEIEKNKVHKSENGLQSNNQREISNVKSNVKIKEMKDSCGLQEKVQVTELELPLCESSRNVEKNRRVVIKEETKKKEMELPQQEPTAPLKSYVNTNKSNINLHHHLLNARNSQYNINECCSEGDAKQHSTKTYRIDKNNSVFFKDVQHTTDETSYSTKANQEATDIKQLRRQEGSKRFSHRLISTSPEQLRSILKESQACYKMAPTIVGQALTEINTTSQSGKSGNEIILQLVIPAINVEKTQLFSGTEIPEKSDKNATSLQPAFAADQNLADVCLSDIQLPLSNLPTSSSTIDLIDSAVKNKKNIILRTLSAPGLLESSWLDPYIVCEMRDSSTNT